MAASSGATARVTTPAWKTCHERRGAFTSDRFNFGGGEYVFNDKRTQVGVWYSELQDIYQQQYFNLLHSQPIGDWTLGANLGFFTGKEDGNKLAGDLDNKTTYALLSARYGGSTFYVGLQKLTGDTAWMRVNGTSGARWPTTVTTPATTTPRRNPGSCATTTTSQCSAYPA